MHRRTPRAVLAAAVAAGIAAPAVVAGDDWQHRFESLESELSELREQNEAQRAELQQLRQEVGEDNWLTDRRAEEMRGLVRDVLADADTRSSLLADGRTAGWDEDMGFFLRHPDDRFRLQLSGEMQFRYIANYHDQPDRWRSGFESTRNRLTFQGHIFNRDFNYLVRGGFDRGQVGAFDETGSFNLLDAWFGWDLTDHWSIRAGQFKLPFAREELVRSIHQQTVERSLINQTMSLGRTQGVELSFHSREFRWLAAISEGGQDRILNSENFFAGAPTINTPALEETTEYSFTTRGEWLLGGTWEQFADFTSPMEGDFGWLVGAAGHYQRSEFGTPSPDRQWLAWTVDSSTEFGGANVFGSFSHFYVDNEDLGRINIFGLVGQAGMYVTPKVELFGRFEFGHVDWNNPGPTVPDEGDLDNLYVGTIGMNYYLDGHDAKFTADLGYGFSKIDTVGTSPVGWADDLAGWRLDGPGADPQIVLRTQFQLLF